MKTYQELSLKEKIVQARLMKRSGWSKPDIAKTLDLENKVVKLIFDNSMWTAEELAEELRKRNYVK
ncbi:hypothetical protein [Pseudanabaena sp. 'Roaring Creek']|uniref:hypothetical protein n=1 Tax=Pseudanabaena sp. 'Roaring Creek' TaxID=1681830 RepID=UPI0006D7EDD4|nr:hypothetical protein [Pseudanabaena sp. 'Roaring Creek']